MEVTFLQQFRSLVRMGHLNTFDLPQFVCLVKR